VAVQIGYCGLDRRRLPLVGDEIRSCWEPAPVIAEPDEGPDRPKGEPLVRTFDFVPLGEAAPVAAGVSGAPLATLWGDATDS
jgi:hypothetical protein